TEIVQMGCTTEQLRQLRDEATRLVLPDIALRAGIVLVTQLLAAGLLRECEAAAAETEALERRIGSVRRLTLRLPYLRCLIGLYRGRWRDELDVLRANAAAEIDERERLHWRLELVHWLGRLGGDGAREELRAAIDGLRSSAQAVDIPVVSGLALLVEAE